MLACGKDDTIETTPIEKKEIFPFLKIGNEWEYEAHHSPIEYSKITIDSIEIISENESKYFGTWHSEWHTIANLLLFHLKDSVLNISFDNWSCYFDYNWTEGQIIDSLDGYNSTGKQQWFPVIVSKGVFNTRWLYPNITFSECIIYKGWWGNNSSSGHPMSWDGGHIEAVLSNKYGLVYYESGQYDQGYYGGSSYRLISTNF